MPGSRVRRALVAFSIGAAMALVSNPAAVVARPIAGLGSTLSAPASSVTARAHGGPGTELWDARYNGPGNSYDLARALAVSPDGTRVFVTGYTYGQTTEQDFVTIAYDATAGTELWRQRYTSFASLDDVPYALAVSPDGTRVFVTGKASGLDYDYVTLAYDAATGAHLWMARYDGTASFGDDIATSVGVSPDGAKVFVTGYSAGSGGTADYGTVAYKAATGAKLWVARYSGPMGANIANGVRVSPDGTKVFVTGKSYGVRYDYATVAYDASTGATLWVARYNGPADRGDIASALSVSPDGMKVFVTGHSSESGRGLDYVTVAYDAATGTQLWVARYDGPARFGDIAHAVSAGPDGTMVFVTGESSGSGTGRDYATVAYDTATGAQVWVARYDGPANGDDAALSVEMSPDGTHLIVTGQSSGSGSGLDYATVAYNASTGAQAWVARYDGPANGDDAAISVGDGPDGTRVFVAGTSSQDYAAVAYDGATGAQVWVSRYNQASGDDGAFAIGASPDGTKMFVTGASVGSTSLYGDYATIAYQASTGARLWVARYDGPAFDYDVDLAYALAVSPDGTRVFVTGWSSGTNQVFDYATVAYDADTGAQLWVARYDGSGHSDDRAHSVAVSPDGARVFVTGWSTTTDGFSEYTTIAYDAAFGAQLWLTSYHGSGVGGDEAVTVAVSPDGTRVFVTGSSTGSSGYGDFATVAYDASTGAQLWVARYHGPTDLSDSAESLSLSPDGESLFVAGTSGLEYITLAYDAATGARLWVSRYDGPGHNVDWAYGIQASPDGARVFVTGQSHSPASGFDYATVAYDAATGAQLWVSRYDGPHDVEDDAFPLVVSPDAATVFVSGWSVGLESEFDYATVAYDAVTGAQLWVARYDGPGHDQDYGRSLAVSPDGTRVFVTGTSPGSGTGSDYATVAYSTT